MKAWKCDNCGSYFNYEPFMINDYEICAICYNRLVEFMPSIFGPMTERVTIDRVEIEP